MINGKRGPKFQIVDQLKSVTGFLTINNSINSCGPKCGYYCGKLGILEKHTYYFERNAWGMTWLFRENCANQRPVYWDYLAASIKMFRCRRHFFSKLNNLVIPTDANPKWLAIHPKDSLEWFSQLDDQYI